MKKIVPAVIIFCSIFDACSSIPEHKKIILAKPLPKREAIYRKTNYLLKENIRGPVKSITEANIYYHNTPINTTNYDVQFFTQYEFDNHGNLLKQFDCSDTTDWNTKEIHFYRNIYNAEGNLIQVTDSCNRYKDYMNFKYDSAKNKVEEEEFSSEGKLEETDYYRYNKLGEVEESTHIFPGNEVIDSTYFLYDSLGDEIIKMDSKKIETSNKVNTEVLDSMGNSIAGYSRIKGGPDIKDDAYFEYKYDSYGNWIEKNFIQSGKVTVFIRRVIRYIP